MLTRDNYIDLYFKEMKDPSIDWLCPYYLQMQEGEHWAGFPMDETISQEDALRHIKDTIEQLPFMREQITQYHYALNKLYNKIADQNEWTLAVANQTFEEDEEWSEDA